MCIRDRYEEPWVVVASGTIKELHPIKKRFWGEWYSIWITAWYNLIGVLVSPLPHTARSVLCNRLAAPYHTNLTWYGHSTCASEVGYTHMKTTNILDRDTILTHVIQLLPQTDMGNKNMLKWYSSRKAYFCFSNVGRSTMMISCTAIAMLIYRIVVVYSIIGRWKHP